MNLDNKSSTLLEMENIQKKKKSSGSSVLLEFKSLPVISISGYFDDDVGGSVLEISESLLMDGKISQIIDFSECIAINSLGVGKLVSVSMRIIDDFQGRLVLVNLRPIMKDVFEFAMIAPPAEIVPDLQSAAEVLI